MLVLKRDLKVGFATILTENLDDLWYLSQLIRAGDRIKSKTQRRIKEKEDSRSSGGERKTITLTIVVERVEYSSESESLRVLGLISSGPEDLVSIGSHHSIKIEPDTQFTLEKTSWNSTEAKVLWDAVDESKKPKMIILAMDIGQATAAVVRNSKTDYVDLESNIGGKYDQVGRGKRKIEYYGQLAELLENLMVRHKSPSIILAGPGFEKNSFHQFLNEHKAELAKTCMIDDVSSAGRSGIQEILKRKTINKALEQVNAVRDLRFVEQILSLIANDSGLAVYGLKDVESAITMNAVETLIITDKLFSKDRELVEKMFKSVKSSNGATHIMNHNEEAGKKLSSIGGLAAKLRFKII